MDAAELAAIVTHAGSHLSDLYGDVPVRGKTYTATAAQFSVPSCASSAVEDGCALARALAADAAAAADPTLVPLGSSFDATKEKLGAAVATGAAAGDAAVTSTA